MIISIVFSFNLFLNNSITLKTALNKASNEAKIWNAQAKLYSMTSIDNPDFNERTNGYNGKRTYWNFQFIVPNTDKLLIVTIHDKKIVTKKESKFMNKEPDFISESEINIDSNQAVNKAKEDFSLQPGKHWAKGYHFNLDKIANKAILTVFGLDKKGYFSNISIDSSTGKVISANHKIPTGGGLFKNEEPILTDKPISAERIYLSPNFENDKTIFTQFYINSYTPDMSLVLSKTTDSGDNWKSLNVNVNDNVRKLLFSTKFPLDNTVYVATENKLLLSVDIGEIWNTIFESTSSIINLANNKEKIVLLTESEIHISLDKGNNWSKLEVPQNTFNMDIDSNGTIFIATSKEIFKLENNKWRKIETTIEKNILGLNLTENHLIFYTSNNISILNTKTNNFNKVINLNDIKKVFLNPDFKNKPELYVLSNDNTLLKLNKNNDWIAEKIVIPNSGTIADLGITSNNELYFCMSSDFVWEKLEKESKK